MMKGIDTMEVIAKGIINEIQTYARFSEKLSDDIAVQRHRENQERQRINEQDKTRRDIITESCPGMYLRGGKGERDHKERKEKEDERNEWLTAIKVMFEEGMGEQMKRLKRLHDYFVTRHTCEAGDIRDSKTRKEVMGFFGKALNEIQSRAADHASRMACTLRAMHADRIMAESERREIEGIEGEHSIEMISVDNAINAQQRRHINTLEEMALNIGPEHITDREAGMRSSLGMLISIWERQKVFNERTASIHTANAKARTGTSPGARPPKPGLDAKCECGSGNKADKFDIYANEWRCRECTGTLWDCDDEGHSDSDDNDARPPPPEEYSCNAKARRSSSAESSCIQSKRSLE